MKSQSKICTQSKVSLTIFLVSIITVANQAQGQIDSQSRGREPTRRSEPTAPTVGRIYQTGIYKPTGLILGVSLGSATFQDIQAPVAKSQRLRIDGTSTVQDSSEHSGFILGANLGWGKSHGLGEGFILFSGSRASSLAPIGAPTASYSRLALEGGTSIEFNPNLKALTALELRRSTFRNADNGHYVDAALVKGGVELSMHQISLFLGGGFSPLSQFGYAQSTGSGTSGSLANTTASLTELNAKISYNPSQDSSLFFGVNQENISVTLDNLGGYRRLGLDVPDDDDSTSNRNYSLSTTSLHLGAIRKF